MFLSYITTSKHLFMLAIIILSTLFTPFSLYTMQKSSTKATATKKDLSADEKRELHRQFYRLVIDSRGARRIEKRLWHGESNLEKLITAGMPINEEVINDDEVGVETHLLNCTRNQDFDNVKFLLKHGAAASILHAPQNYECKAYSGSLVKCKYTPLFVAVQLNSIEILRLFLEHGITIDLDQRPGLLIAAKALYAEETSAVVIRMLEDHWKKSDKKTLEEGKNSAKNKLE